MAKVKSKKTQLLKSDGSVLTGQEFGDALLKAGIIPPNCGDVIIEVPVGGVVVLHMPVFANRNLLKLIPTRVKPVQFHPEEEASQQGETVEVTAAIDSNLRLNLGACDRRFPGYLSVDICEPADVIADLSGPWPWADSSVASVIAMDVFEHLPDKRHTMNELCRVLQPGGKAKLQIPHATLGDGGHCDPTHCSYWTTSDFEYYDPTKAERSRFKASEYYGVKADFRITNLTKPGSLKCVQCATIRAVERCIGGHIPTQRFARSFGGYVVEMQIELEAIK